MSTKITKWMFTVVVLIRAVSGDLTASLIDDSMSHEHVGFFVRGLKICHQGQWRNMNVALEYASLHSAKALEVSHVKGYVRQFLESYPNTTDFWEIMNTKLVYALIKEFTDISNVKVVLSLAPDKTLSFPRESTVFYDKEKKLLKESFKFIKLNYLICNETFESLNLHVAFDLKDNPAPNYPDYQWVDQAMEEFFRAHPISVSNWRELKPHLEAFLLDRFSLLKTLEIDVVIAK